METLKKINLIFTKRQKIRLILLFVIILGGTVMELLGVSAILPLVNAVLTPDTMLENVYVQYVYELLHLTSPSQIIILMSAGLILVYILKNIYLLGMYKAQYQFVYNNQRRLSTQLMNCYMHQPYIFHTMHNSSELIRNISADSAMFFSSVLAFLQLFTEVSVCAVLFLFLLFTDTAITFAVTILMVFFLLIFMRYNKRKIIGYGQLNRKYAVSQSKCLRQAFGSIKETLILGKESYFVDFYNKSVEKSMEAQKKYQLLSILPRPIMETVCISGLLIIVIIKLLLGQEMQGLIPTLSVFAIAAVRMLPSFNRISGYLTAISYNKPGVDTVYECLKDAKNLLNKIEEKQMNAESIPFKKDIRVSQVSFRYPNTEKYVLKDVSIEIPKNKSIAFIGPSGAGKTTLADIILGVLEPEKGKILVDGTDISGKMSAWHNKIGYIPQSIYLVDDTLRNNVAFGMDSKRIDDEKVWRALERAQLKTFVAELEEGLDTVIGEHGTRLSGGQRQRIGIARAMYNEPEVLVLDEATSALDNDTEAAVMEAINNLAGSKTLLIIAHRLSTIEKCEIIYEIKETGVTTTENV